MHFETLFFLLLFYVIIDMSTYVSRDWDQSGIRFQLEGLFTQHRCNTFTNTALPLVGNIIEYMIDIQVEED